MKRTLTIILFLLPILSFSQVSARYDISEVTYVNDSTWHVYGEIVDPTGSYNAEDISVGDKIVQRGFDTTGVTVYDRFRVVSISTDDVLYLGANVRHDEAGAIKNNAGCPLTGSFPIGSTVDSSNLTYKPSWYQYNIDPDYDAGIDNMNLHSRAISVSKPLTYTGSALGIDSTKRSMSPQVISLKAAGVVSDAVLSIGSTSEGTDQTAKIQAILNKASATNPLYIIWDVKVGVKPIYIKSYTYIFAPPDCGAILRTGSTAGLPLIRNNNRYNVSVRDTCITIDGGIWNGNKANNQYHLFEFFRVGNLTLKNLKMYDTRYYTVFLRNMVNLLIENFVIDNGVNPWATGNDGIHIRGWNKNLTIRNGTISAYDDNIAIYSEQFEGSPLTLNALQSGKVDGVFIENIILKNSLNGLKLVSGQGLIDNVHIKNISGSTGVYAMVIDRWWVWSLQISAGSGNFGNITVENFNVTLNSVILPYVNSAIILIGASAKKLIFKDIKRETYISGQNVKTIYARGLYKFHPTIDNLIIDGYDANDTVLASDNISHIMVDSCDVGNLVVNRANLSVKSAAVSGSSLISVGSFAKVNKIQLNGVIADKTYNLVNNQSTIDTIIATNIIHSNADTSFRTSSTINYLMLSNYLGKNKTKGTFTTVSGDAYAMYPSTTETVTGTKYFTGKLHGGYGASTGAAALELGQGRTDNGTAYIDFHGDTTNSDFGLRIIRNDGVNGSAETKNQGDGDIKFVSVGSGDFVFRSDSKDRLRLSTTELEVNVPTRVGVNTYSKLDSIALKLASEADTTGKGSSASVGKVMYYDGHFYGLIKGSPPEWKQLDN